MLLTALVLLTLAAAVTFIGFERARRRHRRAAARWDVGSRIGVVLAEGLEKGHTVREVLRLLVPAHADWCVLHLVEDGHIRRAALVHRDAAMEQRLRETFERRSLIVEEIAGTAQVIQTGASRLIRELGSDRLESPPDSGILRDAGFGSCIACRSKRGRIRSACRRSAARLRLR